MQFAYYYVMNYFYNKRYSPAAFDPLISALRALCTPNYTTIIFAYKRRYEVEDQFFTKAEQYFEFTRVWIYIYILFYYHYIILVLNGSFSFF